MFQKPCTPRAIDVGIAPTKFDTFLERFAKVLELFMVAVGFINLYLFNFRSVTDDHHC